MSKLTDALLVIVSIPFFLAVAVITLAAAPFMYLQKRFR